MARIKIKDLDVDLEELKKKDPEILKKIRGGVTLGSLSIYPSRSLAPTYFQCQATSGWGYGGFGVRC